MKDEDIKPMINLKIINVYIVPHHLKMEGIHNLKYLIKRNDWMTKVDLKNVYFYESNSQLQQVSYLLLESEMFLPVLIHNIRSVCGLWVFIKTLNPVLIFLRELGVRLVAYIDDIMCLVEMKEMVMDYWITTIP